MSFLAPLYALAAAAIAAPILFHMFQRRPEGEQDFSSLMFLRPSPPQLTKRHRLNNLLLLFLRGLALALLAAAFARPFLRSTVLLDLEAPARSIALVVDTSASMKRAGIWPQVQENLNRVLDDLRAVDEVTLISFDREPTTVISFEAWEDTDPSRRLAFLRQQIDALKPSWHNTGLGEAVVYASDALLQQKLLKDHKHGLQLVLFSDLQQGSSMEALQAYQWAEDVFVDLRLATADEPSNGSVQWLPPATDQTDASQIRLLVRNEPGGDSAQLELSWADGETTPHRVHVPPGQARVVRIAQPSGAQQLRLDGDNQPFDNTLFVTETVQQRRRLLFAGAQPADPRGLFFFLKQATLDSRTQRVAIEELQSTDTMAGLIPAETPLVVFARPLEAPELDSARSYVDKGGRLLLVLIEEAHQAMADSVRALLKLEQVSIESVVSRDYAMLARIDFQHPLFRPLDDPRFSDFTKIQFWKHRRLSSHDENPWVTLASFDDESPALVQKDVGEGSIFVLTSGWHAADSQLGLSSKFVPLLFGLYGNDRETVSPELGYEVGSPIEVTVSQSATSVHSPVNDEAASMPAQSTQYEATDAPGIYTFARDGETFDVAVNLGRDESRTSPLTPDRLEQLGVRLGKHQSIEVTREQQRQMRNVELESRQKLWRWGVLVVLLIVTVETWLGSRASVSQDGRSAVGAEA